MNIKIVKELPVYTILFNIRNTNCNKLLVLYSYHLQMCARELQPPPSTEKSEIIKNARNFLWTNYPNYARLNHLLKL